MTRKQHLLTALTASLLLAAGACEDPPPAGDAVATPSGRAVQALDVVTNAPGPKGATARFRFVVPGLTAEDDPGADMEAVCNNYALPRIGGMVPAPQQIIIVFADRAVPFGEVSPDAVQVFEAYRVENDVCIWEMF